MAPIKHWLDQLEDLFRTFDGSSAGVPICFLLGAGASLSSNAPSTAAIVSALMSARPDLFPDPGAVYAGVHRLSLDDRAAINSRLFGEVVPNIGYRCIAAMARSRPIIVVNLNWDDCLVQACTRLGVPEHCVASVHLEDVDEVAKQLKRLRGRRRGLLSVHVHGRIEDPDERPPSFGTNETLKFNPPEFKLLQKLLNFQTYVIGTSLAGPYDAKHLVEALRPPAGAKKARVRRIWVVERGSAAKVPDLLSPAGDKLNRALSDRNSTANFVAGPDVDFDMFMVALRATEVGYTWEAVQEEADALLPDRSELVPPSPAVVRPLLDGSGILVGRPGVGKWSVAHQVGHWLAILENPPRRLRSVKGGRAIARALEESGAESPPGVVLGGDCFGRGSFRECSRLFDLVERCGGAPGIILASRPEYWFRALGKDAALERKVPVVPFQASRAWEKRALKAYARRLEPRGAENLEEAIERGELTTPLQVERASEGKPPGHEDEEPEQLASYLMQLRDRDEEQALAVALVRLQDLSHAVPRSRLAASCEADLQKLVDDPWELVAAIEIDDEYLCLARREVIAAIDRWMDDERDWLVRRIARLGEHCHWAREGLARWQQLRDFDPEADSLAELESGTIELLGPELIEPALGVSPKRAMSVLRVMFDSAPDAWALRETAFELVRWWDNLCDCPKAQELPDAILADGGRHGAYALFEGLLRHGGIGDIELWSSVVAALTNMSRTLDEDENRRQVALCFDALLWRRAPADERQYEMLLRRLLKASEDDELLRAAYAAAAAYHWDGAARLVSLGLPNPIDGLGYVSEAAAREMRWVVEWHFVNQSRNRALASRRFFRSTRSTLVAPDQPRLLSRKPLKRILPAPAAHAVSQVVTQMGRFPSTAGWGFHMIANVFATSGQFDLPKLAPILENAEIDDHGMVWSAVTYEVSRRLGQALQGTLRTGGGSDAVQRALAGELEVDGTSIRTPRFVTCVDPWKGVRSLLGMDLEILADLGLPEDEPLRFVEVARESRDEAVAAAGVGERPVDELIERIAAGDLRLIERVHSHSSWFAERARRKREATGELPDLRARVLSLLVVGAKLLAVERGAG